MLSIYSKILSELIDKYESSKQFNGRSKINRSISCKLARLYPEYDDDSEYEFYRNINEAVGMLEKEHLISADRMKNGKIDSVALNIDNIEKAYAFISRKPKSAVNAELITLLDNYASHNDTLKKFCCVQKERLSNNKNAEYFNGDLNEYENILYAVSKLYMVREETYIRDFSVRTFGDSKLFECIKSKVCSLLFEYGDLPEKETVLEELNIVKNPGHVFF